jgi:hypothetical protein
VGMCNKRTNTVFSDEIQLFFCVGNRLAVSLCIWLSVLILQSFDDDDALRRVEHDGIKEKSGADSHSHDIC